MPETRNGFGARTGSERIVAFTKNLTNPNLQAFRLGADRAAALLGASVIHRIPTKPDDAAQQIDLLATMLAEKPDAILLGPAEDKALEPIIERLNAARIPIVNFASRMAAGDFLSYVGSDDVDMGCRAARYLLTRMRNHGNVVIIEGPQTTSTSRDRVEGFKKALAECSGIHLVASVAGKYHEHDAYEAMSKVLKEFDKIDAVLCANDSMAMGLLMPSTERGAARSSSESTAQSRRQKQSSKAASSRASTTVVLRWVVSQRKRPCGVSADLKFRHRSCCRRQLSIARTSPAG
jgi:ribose transport system substrate-binding protein